MEKGNGESLKKIGGERKTVGYFVEFGHFFKQMFQRILTSMTLSRIIFRKNLDYASMGLWSSYQKLPISFYNMEI